MKNDFFELFVILRTSFFSVLPSIIYLVFLYFVTPYKSWDLSRSFLFLMFGVLSTSFVILFHNIFPFFENIWMISDQPLFQLMILTFIGIALLEESMKLFCFNIYYFFLKKIKAIKEPTPLSVMIYCGSIALGFSFAENILYASNYGDQVLLSRSMFSVPLHMLCGFMIGYWVSLSKFGYRLRTNPGKNISSVSILDVIVKRYPKLRSFLYSLLGVLMATFFHGLYDMNLMAIRPMAGKMLPDLYNISYTILMVIVAFSLYLVKKMADHLIKLNENK